MKDNLNYKSTRHNTGFAKVTVRCSADTFVVNQTLVLRINICAKNPAHRKSAKTLPAMLEGDFNQSENFKNHN
jgi:hypothetical protein